MGTKSAGDKNVKQPPVMEVAEITQLLSEVGAAPECPVCKHNTWQLPDGTPSGQMDLILHRPNEDLQHRSGFRTFMMVCKNCGFLRVHSAAIIKNAIDSPKEESNDG